LGLAAHITNAPASSDLSFTGAIGALHALVADNLEAVNAVIAERLASKVEVIPEISGHLVGAGGKRLRPMLTLGAAHLFGYRGREHVKLAAAVELIHGATLLHDDVVDESTLRRGAATANTIWGNKPSVLVGDYIFSRAFELMVTVGDLGVLRILSEASCVIAEGEVLQLSTQKNLDATFEMYLAVVEAKTAALFAAAAQAGAAVAGAREAQQEAVRGYGLHLGIAYQLVDDALDYAGSEDVLGKGLGADFREGKMTAPVVFALERASGPERAFWKRTIAEGRIEDGDFERAREILRRTQAVAETLRCARRHASLALDCLAAAPAGEVAAALARLAETSVSRTF
jgi:octaprenyl-diphosphate synthase